MQENSKIIFRKNIYTKVEDMKINSLKTSWLGLPWWYSVQDFTFHCLATRFTASTGSPNSMSLTPPGATNVPVS